MIEVLEKTEILQDESHTKIQFSSTRLLSLGSSQEVQIKWLDSGKPVIEGLERQQVEVSLSHDERFCLCVVGAGPQGCDILPITQRSREDWFSLLSSDRKPLLNHLLLSNSEPIDVAGTRLWAAMEALRKAFNVRDINLSIDSQQGDTILFRGTSSNKDLYVMTFFINLTPSLQRIVAIIVNKNEAFQQ